MKKAKIIVIALVGGFGYGLCEIMWRGYTHPSMFFLGAVCFCGIYEIQRRFFDVGIAMRCVAGGVLITSLELVFGMVVNVWLGLGVWDYSDKPFNLYGQICPQYFAAWVLLCVPSFFICSELCKKNEKNCAQIE